MKYFDNFTKMPKNVGDLSKIIVAQSAINRPIWSHWSLARTKIKWKKIYRFKESP